MRATFLTNAKRIKLQIDGVFSQGANPKGSTPHFNLERFERKTPLNLKGCGFAMLRPLWAVWTRPSRTRPQKGSIFLNVVDSWCQ